MRNMIFSNKSLCMSECICKLPRCRDVEVFIVGTDSGGCKGREI